MTAVSLTGVSKIFNPGRPDEVAALSGIDLTIPAGQFVSLIGPSGCGKSTLLRLIADLTPASAGTVEVAGKPAARARLDQEYGIAFQQAGLFEWRTVQRNVELPLELRGASRAERRARATEMLALVGLADFAGHYPAQLSGGMQQRVAIARALAVHPPLLLMDEPFGALDEMTRERLQSELLAICAQTGTSTVFVTHSISEAVFLSDRVVVMSPRPGRITATIDVELGTRDDAARQSPAYFAAITAVRRALRGPGPVPDIVEAEGAAAVAAPSPRTSGPASSATAAP
ncbi:ABC transporter ATP-binding protein [Actinoplanes auranticolor]|uniref:Sulfonate ABC transporter ATP-binding lipoprotein n=1 Tax=Actinoplanes auranticolor TaxID=47988 RepID=A0A919SEI8_9ACTN|nr:ABC transporter ATP-binding protein [Actinoplanes auranticolor]GIM70366.1 sulfonate ABC transporter ATP-binding lipoprotein [Actinoplanes auranticolor]